AVLPLILTSLPLFGINIIHNSYFEWMMIALAFGVGIYSLYHGYQKHRASWLPMILFFAGFCFLIAKQFFSHSVETMLLLPAVFLIISAHYFNYRMCRRSRCSSPHQQH
ncbi:MAG: MerC domain-containing protein, partial [Ferruginibacter sp.]